MKTKENILENLRHTLHNFKHLPSSRYIEDAINYIESLPVSKELEPLPNPSDLGDEIYDLEWHTLTPQDCEKLADYFIRKYGTPKREELPSVYKLVDEIRKVVDDTRFKEGEESIMNLAKHLVNKYYLPKREWWMDLKQGDKFVYLDKIIKSDGKIYLFGKGEGISDVNLCTPYIEPTTREKLLAKLDDEGKELLKQWEAER